MSYSTIMYQEDEGIGLLTLNRPERINALNQTMLEEVDGLLDALAIS